MLKTKDLHIGYHQKLVAKDINLSISKNSLVSVIGENGSGKSTLLKTIGQILKPISGQILLNDVDVKKIPNSQLSKQISLVFSEQIYQTQFTVFEMVAIGRQPFTNWIHQITETDKKIVNNALQATNTLDLATQKFNKLSDGQQQRVLIARALAQDTPIIILDEPTSHLDLHQTIKIFKLLKELCKNADKTIIFTTHNINLALKFADEFAILKNETITFGSKKELIKNGVFETIFPNNLISFDKESQQFNINND